VGSDRVSFFDASDKAKLGGTFYYKIVAYDRSGEHTVYGPIEIEAIDRTPPGRFALYPARPNPVRGTTFIRYDMPTPAYVEFRVYNVAGRLVRTLLSGEQPAGRLIVAWDGRDNRGSPVAAGIYFYRMQAGTFLKTKKLVVQR
jgi:hypothetical protein